MKLLDDILNINLSFLQFFPLVYISMGMQTINTLETLFFKVFFFLFFQVFSYFLSDLCKKSPSIKMLWFFLNFSLNLWAVAESVIRKKMKSHFGKIPSALL